MITGLWNEIPDFEKNSNMNSAVLMPV